MRVVGKEIGLYPTDDDDPFTAAKNWWFDGMRQNDIVVKIDSVWGKDLKKKHEKEKARAEACQAGGVTSLYLQTIDTYISAKRKRL